MEPTGDAMGPPVAPIPPLALSKSDASAGAGHGRGKSDIAERSGKQAAARSGQKRAADADLGSDAEDSDDDAEDRLDDEDDEEMDASNSSDSADEALDSSDGSDDEQDEDASDASLSAAAVPPQRPSRSSQPPRQAQAVKATGRAARNASPVPQRAAVAAAAARKRAAAQAAAAAAASRKRKARAAAFEGDSDEEEDSGSDDASGGAGAAAASDRGEESPDRGGLQLEGDQVTVKEVERILAQRPLASDSAGPARNAATAQTGTAAAAAAAAHAQHKDDKLPPSERAPIPPYACEYYVKWKNLSYLHAEWVHAAVILAEGVPGRNKIQRFLRTQEQKALAGIDEEDTPFPPEWTVAERIVAERRGPHGRQFLVKWQGRPYAQCSWESETDVREDELVAQFRKFNHGVRSEKPKSRGRTAFDTRAFMASPPTYKNDNRLRAYQVEGLAWLVQNWHLGRGCILADEMGLGKTVQAATFLEHLFSREHVPGPFLVVAPLSTIPNWQREFDTWTDMDVCVYTGGRLDREVIRRFEWYPTDPETARPTSTQVKFHVLLTTFEMINLDDASDLRNIEWRALIVDEAQRLKSLSSKLLNRLSVFRVDHRVLMSGTPLQNNTTELFTLLHFIQPDKFASVEAFRAQYGELRDSEQVQALQELLRPHFLRRMKEDVEKAIPPKEETIIEVELTALQKQYYRAVLEKNRAFLSRGTKPSNAPNLLNIVMELRKVCNHPFLIRGVEDRVVSPSAPPEEYLSQFVTASGKFVLLDKLLPKLHAQGHKVLIFSQMVRVLDLLETYLRYRQYPFERLDGGVRGDLRQAAIDRFCKPGSASFVFLLCTRAGGVGINLAAADTVIIFDSDWNPQNDLQAQSRCHRIGQTKEVKVYRLLTRKTYEREMFERASKKLGLEQALLGNMRGADFAELKRPQQLSLEDVDALLKHGAYDVFRDEDDAAAREFCEADIDRILERSTQVVRYEGPRGNTFSKASFVVSEADAKIDVNAADFWERVLPEEKTPERLLQRLRTPDALAAERALVEFLQDVHTLVKEAISAWEDDKPIAVGGLVTLLRECVVAPLFNDAQRALLHQWLEVVEHPRRKRRAVDKFTLTQHAQSVRRVKTLTAEELSHHKKKPPVEVVKLTRARRKKFIEGLLMFGFSRLGTDVLAHVRRGEPDTAAPLTADDMHRFAVELLQVCKYNAQDVKEREVFHALQATLLPHAVPESTDGGSTDEQSLPDLLPSNYEYQPTLTDASFARQITPRLRVWAKRFRLLEHLCELVHADTKPSDLQVPDVQRKPTTWWDSYDDACLLVGTYRHGFGNYATMCADESLSFGAKLRAHGQELPVAERKPGSNVGAGAGPEPAAAAADGADTSAPDGADAGAVDEDGAGAMDEDAPSPAPPTGAAGGSDETPAAAAAKKGTAISAAWPGGRVLDAQVKAVVDAIRKAQSRQRKKAQAAAERAAGLKGEGAKRHKISAMWGHREAIMFRNALLMYGPGDWERLRTKAQLHKKTAAMLEAFYPELLAYCQRIVAEGAAAAPASLVPLPALLEPPASGSRSVAGTPGGDGKPAAGAGDGDGDEAMDVDVTEEPAEADEGESADEGDAGAEEQDEEEDAQGQTPLRPAAAAAAAAATPRPAASTPGVATPASAAPAAAAAAASAGTTPGAPPAKTPRRSAEFMPVHAAKRFVRRMEMFDTLRNKVLPHPEMETRVRGAMKMDMPHWWRQGDFDLVLLRGVSEMGIGSVEWQQYLEDPACPLYLDKDGQPAAVKLKEKFLLDFVSDKLPLMQRLEYLFLLVIDPTFSTSQTWRKRVASFSHQRDRAIATRAFGGRRKRDGEPDSDGDAALADGMQPPADGEGEYMPLNLRLNDTSSDVPRDADGNPILPFVAKGATIQCLGHIIWDKPGFHRRDYLFPVGFKSSRRLPSIVNRDTYVEYTSEIIDSGHGYPLFKVTAADDPDHPFIEKTSSKVWQETLKKVKRRQTVSVSGPEMMGTSDPLVRRLFEELPNADKCKEYVFSYIPRRNREKGPKPVPAGSEAAPGPAGDAATAPEAMSTAAAAPTASAGSDPASGAGPAAGTAETAAPPAGSAPASSAADAKPSEVDADPMEA